MAESQLPRSATANATPAPGEIRTVPSPTERGVVYVRFDPDYLGTVPGIVKIVQISLILLGFICSMVSLHRSSPTGKFFSWTSMLAVCYSGTLLGLYVFHVVEKYQHKIPWLKIELAFCGIWTLLLLVASSVTMSQGGDSPLVVAGNIGLRSTVAYGVDFYLMWRRVMRGNLAQEERVRFQYPVMDAVNAAVISPVQLPTIQQTV